MATVYLRPRPQRWWQGRWASLLRDLLQRYVLFPLLRIWCRRLRVEATQMLAEVRGPAIIVANHSSHFDTALVLSALPPGIRRRVTVAAAADYFYNGGLKGAAVSLLFNTFPFHRNGGAQRSLSHCADLLQGGWWLLIYPEGTRSLDGNIQPFKGGVGLLAVRLGVPVVPVHLEGAHGLMPKGNWRPRRRAVTVRIGDAVAYPPQTDAVAVANDLRSRVVALAGNGPSGGQARPAKLTRPSRLYPIAQGGPPGQQHKNGSFATFGPSLGDVSSECRR
ncbi:MAG: lysophospholipid acyltransferase family protein [Dehalococcoidia bacterium]